MALTKVLVTVKTYPTLSAKYEELVCTAGFREDGSWIRIYPIPFRKKSYNEQYRKYDWIELDLVKNKKDFRPESYRPFDIDGPIKLIGHIETNNNWAERKKICLKKVYTNLSELILDARNKNLFTSLATFKPKKIIDFIIEEDERVWNPKKIALLEAERRQGDLYKQPENPFEIVQKIPYKFKFHFEDEKGKEAKMMIEDWETGELYRNCLKKHNGDEKMAILDVKKKYLDDFAKTKDLHLFLGTTLAFHNRSKNPFMIIGTFHPKREIKVPMFDF